MKLIALGVLAAAAMAIPASSFAAMYAYVNSSGEVMTHEAATADAALQTAPNLHVRSGVMLISDSNDADIVGDDVPGT